MTLAKHFPGGTSSQIGGWEVVHVASITSTNEVLVDLSTHHELPHHTVLVADEQTAGRGRLDRRWDAPAGSNLLCSWVVHAELPGVQHIQRVVALAVIEAAAACGAPGLRLKWPNDVVSIENGQSNKVCGMLSALTGSGHLIVGTGINVGWAPDGATSIGQLSQSEVHPLEVLEAMIDSMNRTLAQPALTVDARHRDLTSTIGQRVRVELPGGTNVIGRALNLAADGSLEVLDDCAATHRFHAGDVIHLRTDDSPAT